MDSIPGDFHKFTENTELVFLSINLTKVVHKCKGIHRKHDRHRGNFRRLDNEISRKYYSNGCNFEW